MLFPYTLYEAVGDASEADAGGEPASAEAGVDPVAEVGEAGAAVEAAEAPATPPWADLQSDPEFQAFIEQSNERAVESVLERLMAEQPPQQAELPELDPFSDNFPAQLAARDAANAQNILAGIEKMIAPLQVTAQEAQIQKASAAAQEVLAGFTDLGEFDKGAAERYADSMYDELAAQYGEGNRAAQIALRKGAEYVHGLETAAYARGQADLKAALGRSAEAPTEPGAAGQGAEAPGEYKDELAVARAWASRQP